MTNRLQAAIKRRTHGRLVRLAIQVVDREVFVEVCTATYYGVQLTIAAIRSVVDETPDLAPARLEFFVGGRELVIHNPFADQVAETAPREGLWVTPSPSRGSSMPARDSLLQCDDSPRLRASNPLVTADCQIVAGV